VNVIWVYDTWVDCIVWRYLVDWRFRSVRIGIGLRKTSFGVPIWECSRLMIYEFANAM